jgi:hypothetical protein
MVLKKILVVRIYHNMVGARKCYLHWVGKGSSKGTKVVIEQHVVSLRPMVDE